jgi:hypothetical protein
MAAAALAWISDKVAGDAFGVAGRAPGVDDGVAAAPEAPRTRLAATAAAEASAPAPNKVVVRVDISAPLAPSLAATWPARGLPGSMELARQEAVGRL